MPTDLDLEREFADIVETLREDRMEVDPFFARELDAKVAAGFPRERRWRPRLSHFGPPALALSALVAVVVGISSIEPAGDEEAASGGSVAGEVAQDTGGDSGGGTVADHQAYQQESAQSAPSRNRAKSPSAAVSPVGPGGSSGGSPASDGREGRKVETSMSLVLGAKPGGVQDVVNRAVNITREHDGFVQTSSVELMEGGGGATLELRIPTDRLESAVTALSRIADVRESRAASQDITQAFVSARSRLSDARAERAGLLRQLARAADDATRERVKAQLRQVSSRIAAAKTDLARVSNRANYSTVNVSVVGDPAAGAEEDDGVWTPGDAFKDALRVLEVAAGVALIALAVGLPLGLIALLALVLARLTQRRRRERLLDAI